jgi:hypothetical protein
MRFLVLSALLAVALSACGLDVKCGRCDGKGKADCTLCEGGKAKCNACIAARDKCRMCKDTGLVMCRACNGVGEQTCPRCAGSGKQQ